MHPVFLSPANSLPYSQPTVQIRVRYHSICRDLAGASESVESLPPGSRLEDLLQLLFNRLPALAAMRKSIRTAVGVDYQTGAHILRDGDEVSLLPPVQGG